MVIADRVAILVNQVYNSPSEYQGFEIVIATIFFAFQIYCDFSGYSDIAIGTARTMGFDLMKNFDSPYFSKSITEFWRRWHISLSTWFRDYLYIPLGGSKNGKYRTYANLFIVFLVSGLWHGAAMTFVIWGAIHGIIIVIEKAFSKQRKYIYQAIGLRNNSIFRALIFTPLIFIIVCFAWVFFRANNLPDAILLIKNIWPFNSDIFSNSSLFEIDFSKPEFIVSIVSICLLLLFEWFHEKSNASSVLFKQIMPIRWSFYLVTVIVIFIFGVYGGEKVEFIYFQF